MNIKELFGRGEKTYIKKCHNQRIPWNLARKKTKNEEDGQDHILSFRELKSYFHKKFEDINENVSAETKHSAKSLKKPVVPSFNYKGYRIQHEFN